jgi:hypothetical protein
LMRISYSSLINTQAHLLWYDGTYPIPYCYSLYLSHTMRGATKTKILFLITKSNCRGVTQWGCVTRIQRPRVFPIHHRTP